MGLALPQSSGARPPQLQLLNQVDFTGGLNLSADLLELKPNESPDLLNVDLDTSGGFRTRSGIIGFGNAAGTAYTHVVINFSGKLLCRTHWSSGAPGGAGTAWTAPDSFSDANIDQNSLERCTAELNDVLFSGLAGAATYKVPGSAVPARTVLTQSGGVWQDDYAAPSGAHGPQAGAREAHRGYLFAGNVAYLAGTTFPNRLHFSHPNDGGSWRSFDYVDVGDKSEKIVGLYTVGDHLLITKTGSTWALYGSDPESFQLVMISDKIGQYTTLGCKTPYGVAWYDANLGVVLYDGKAIKWIFEKIARAAVYHNNTNSLSIVTGSQLVWWGDSSATTNNDTDILPRLCFNVTLNNQPVVFMWDPRLGVDGGWTMYKWFTSGMNLQMFRYVSTTGVAYNYLFEVSGTNNNWFSFGNNGSTVGPIAYDVTSAAAKTAFTSYYKTAWMTAGQPHIRKNFRRPEFIVRSGYNASAVTDIMTITVYKDYDATTVAKTLTVTTAQTGAQYNPDKNVRGSSIGTARAVMLKISLPNDVNNSIENHWYLSSMLLKFRTKPPRS